MFHFDTKLHCSSCGTYNESCRLCRSSVNDVATAVVVAALASFCWLCRVSLSLSLSPSLSLCLSLSLPLSPFLSLSLSREGSQILQHCYTKRQKRWRLQLQRCIEAADQGRDSDKGMGVPVSVYFGVHLGLGKLRPTELRHTSVEVCWLMAAICETWVRI